MDRFLILLLLLTVGLLGTKACDPSHPIVCKNINVMLAGNGYVTVAASQVVESVGCQTTYHNYTTTYRCQNASSTLPFVINAVKGGIAYSCTANVTVSAAFPTAVCVNKTLVLYLNGINNVATLYPSQVDGGSIDKCSSFTSNITVDGGLPETFHTFNCSTTGNHSVNLTVTGAGGSNDSCAIVVQVMNNTKAIVCQNSTVFLNTSGQYNVQETDYLAGLSCGSINNSPSLLYTCPNVSTSPNPFTASVQDSLGNNHTCVSHLTVLSNQTLSLVCKAGPFSFSIDPTGSYNLSNADMASMYTLSDPCGNQAVQFNQTMFGCQNIGNNTVLVSVSDFYGFMASCTVNVLITTTTFPKANAEIDLYSPKYYDRVLPSVIDYGTLDASGASVSNGAQLNYFLNGYNDYFPLRDSSNGWPVVPINLTVTDTTSGMSCSALCSLYSFNNFTITLPENRFVNPTTLMEFFRVYMYQSFPATWSTNSFFQNITLYIQSSSGVKVTLVDSAAFADGKAICEGIKDLRPGEYNVYCVLDNNPPFIALALSLFP